MVIAFIEGSPITAPDAEYRLMRKLQPIAKEEDELICLFAYDTPFLRIAEWVVRKLRASFPEKKIQSVGVFNRADMIASTFPARYTTTVLLDPEENVRRWMVDQADFVFTFMDSLLYANRECELAYQCAVKQNCCVNLCIQEDMDEVRERIPSLVRWERRALLGKLNGEPKTEVTKELGVSKTTLKKYEMEAAYHLARSLCPKKPAGRRCAVFGFSSLEMPLEQRRMLWWALDYLQHGCGVTTFLVSTYTMRRNLEFEDIIMRFCRRRSDYVDLIELPDAKDPVEEKEGTSLASKILAERRVLIDAADIVLCDLRREYRTGLLYAKRRKVPVINLSEIEKGKAKGDSHVREQVESIQWNKK